MADVKRWMMMWGRNRYRKGKGDEGASPKFEVIVEVFEWLGKNEKKG